MLPSASTPWKPATITTRAGVEVARACCSSSMSRMRALVNALSVRIAHLAAGVALRLDAQLLQRDREQADRDLLAGGGDDVELARIGVRRELACASAEQAVGLAASSPTRRRRAGGPRAEARDAPRDVLDALDAADRGAAVFLDDQCHGDASTGAAAIAIARGYQSVRNTSVPLVPPKPNEFDSATSIFISRAVFGT